MNMQTDSKKTIIVGGGLAGLTAAAYLARTGANVTLYEKASKLGGRAATYQEGEVLFNLGAHALYKGGWGQKVLDELGVSYSGKEPRVNGWAVRGNQIYPLPASIGNLLKTGLLNWRDKLAVMSFFGSVAKLKPENFENVTIRQWVEGRFKGKQVRELFLTLARLLTYQNAPDSGSAALFLTGLKASFSGGVLYLDGGWQTLVDGLANVARQAGAQISTGAGVEKVELSGGRAVGVWLKDGTYQSANAVILATTPEVVAKLVEQKALQATANATVRVEAACLDLALRKLPHPERTFALGIEKPLYFSVHSPFAKLAPEGTIVLHSAKYLEVGKKSDPQADRRDLEELLDTLQPGWRAEIIHERFLPHMLVDSAVALASSGGLTGRPSVTVAGVDALYLAGDWIGNEGWLSDASFASGYAAAKLAGQIVKNNSQSVLAS